MASSKLRQPQEFRDIIEGQLAAVSEPLSEALVESLYATCGNMLLAALDAIDHNQVWRLTLPNKRLIYQVAGSESVYKVKPFKTLYCPCEAFRATVLMERSHVLCRHILGAKRDAAQITADKNAACRLADRLNAFVDREVSFDWLASYLKEDHAPE